MASIEQSDERLHKASEIARFLNVGKSSVYLMAKQGKIPCVRFGIAGIRFDRWAVLAALSKPAKGK